MIIDFHTHFFPEKLAGIAMAKLNATSSVPSNVCATKAAILKMMDECGIDKSVALHIATKEKQHNNVLNFAKECNSERIISFGSVVPTAPSALEYLQKIADAKLKGIKLHPPMQFFDADDEKAFPVYDLARALGLIIVFHAGWESGFDWSHSTPQRFINIAKNFPGLKIVAAHMGGLKLYNEVYETVAGKYDIFFDTSFLDEKFISYEMFRKMVDRHGAENFLFGSDFPWHMQNHELEFVRKCKLDDRTMELILCKNALRLLNI